MQQRVLVVLMLAAPLILDVSCVPELTYAFGPNSGGSPWEEGNVERFEMQDGKTLSVFGIQCNRIEMWPHGLVALTGSTKSAFLKVYVASGVPMSYQFDTQDFLPKTNEFVNSIWPGLNFQGTWMGVVTWISSGSNENFDRFMQLAIITDWSKTYAVYIYNNWNSTTSNVKLGFSTAQTEYHIPLGMYGANYSMNDILSNVGKRGVWVFSIAEDGDICSIAFPCGLSGKCGHGGTQYCRCAVGYTSVFIPGNHTVCMKLDGVLECADQWMRYNGTTKISAWTDPFNNICKPTPSGPNSSLEAAPNLCRRTADNVSPGCIDGSKQPHTCEIYQCSDAVLGISRLAIKQQEGGISMSFGEFQLANSFKADSAYMDKWFYYLPSYFQCSVYSGALPFENTGVLILCANSIIQKFCRSLHFRNHFLQLCNHLKISLFA